MLSRLHHSNTLGSDIEGGRRQDKPEAREGTDGANLRFLEVPAIGRRARLPQYRSVSHTPERSVGLWVHR